MSATWPWLREYKGNKLKRIAMPLGGIGTGTISLNGRGGLVHWELLNRPAKGFIPTSQPPRPTHPTFLVRADDGKKPARARLLEGPLFLDEYEGAQGSPTPNHAYPRFKKAVFRCAYPLAEVALSDKGFPAEISLQAFNPLVPGDADASGSPIVMCRYRAFNPGKRPLTVTVAALVPNFIGCLIDKQGQASIVRENRTFSDGRVVGVRMSASGVPAGDRSDGTFTICADASPDVRLIEKTERGAWNSDKLHIWDRFLATGEIVGPAPNVESDTVAALTITRGVAPGETADFPIYLTWRFPNRHTWTPHNEPDDLIGNYYATQFADAEDVARQVVPRLPELERDTVRFVQAFLAGDPPDTVKEAALFNLSTLRSETCFRAPDGRLFAFEGCGDTCGCCLGSCSHVWNYELATAFLFGDLARSMREVEFQFATHPETGFMPFRVHLPLRYAKDSKTAAADGQMGCLMKLYREWRLSGDDDFLKALWPNARKALEFCWVKGGWDADRDGVMEGCQHNTMDVEYYGPNPQMTIWYLGALRAMEEMATYLGETDFAADCRKLFDNGSAWTDRELFNGEYYEQKVPASVDADAIAPGLRLTAGKISSPPDFQIGPGCLIDQLVGQFIARAIGLGPLISPKNERTTLRSIAKYNRRALAKNDFNPMRSYALGDEDALIMASYPRGERPATPFPYFAEVMTGFEYVAAIGAIYAGDIELGVRLIGDIRARYDGEKRNPFDEAECGHHYGRAMASWAAVNALCGFEYSAVNGTARFADRDGSWFWSDGRSWGLCVIADDEVKFQCLHGETRLRRFELGDKKAVDFSAERVVKAGETLTFTVK